MEANNTSLSFLLGFLEVITNDPDGEDDCDFQSAKIFTQPSVNSLIH